MLDVHAPHETIHSWKSFSIHIAAIVVGLLIAVALEQMVEFPHHRHQSEQLTAALLRDGEANRGYIRDDIAKAQGVLEWALGQIANLERAGPTGPLFLHRMPRGFIGSPDAGVWPSANFSLPAHKTGWNIWPRKATRHLFLPRARVLNWFRPTPHWIKPSSGMRQRHRPATSMSPRFLPHNA
jgi:hypothetical protein